MKAFEISGGNGSYIEMDDGRFADTVVGDTSESTEPHEALANLQAEVTESTLDPMHTEFSIGELEDYVGADKA